MDTDELFMQLCWMQFPSMSAILITATAACNEMKSRMCACVCVCVDSNLSFCCKICKDLMRLHFTTHPMTEDFPVLHVLTRNNMQSSSV